VSEQIAAKMSELHRLNERVNRDGMALKCLPIVFVCLIQPIRMGGPIVDKHRLYDANVPFKVNNRCCTLLCFTSQSISGWHFT
jgi:hypothetical protein